MVETLVASKSIAPPPPNQVISAESAVSSSPQMQREIGLTQRHWPPCYGIGASSAIIEPVGARVQSGGQKRSSVLCRPRHLPRIQRAAVSCPSGVAF